MPSLRARTLPRTTFDRTLALRDPPLWTPRNADHPLQARARHAHSTLRAPRGRPCAPGHDPRSAPARRHQHTSRRVSFEGGLFC